MFKVRFHRGVTPHNQERIARAARILVEPLLVRMKETEAKNISLENKLAAAKSKAAEVAAQNNQRRMSLESCIKELEEENAILGNRLTAAKFKVSQVETQLGVRIRVILLEERIKEITAENVRLEHRLTSAKSKARQATQARSALEARVGELEEKNTRLEHTLTERGKELSALKADAARNDPTALKSRIETLERAAAFPHLKFGPDAERDYAKLSGKEWRTVSKRLTLLDESANEWRVKGCATPPWKCEVKDESNTVKEGKKKWLPKRVFRSHDGTRKTFTLHTQFGDRRIHLRIDPSKREVEIGYIGDHLPIPTA